MQKYIIQKVLYIFHKYDINKYVISIFFLLILTYNNNFNKFYY